MASEDRQEAPALEALRRLEETPYRYSFFTAIRLLDTVFRDSPTTGASARANQEPVRLGQEPSLVFEPATISSFGHEQGKWRMQSQFLGLFGPHGPLPLHLTEFARDRIRNSDDETFARFADMFHHRMLSLFYRAWAQSQPTVQFDRPEADRFADYVGSLFGIGPKAFRNRDAMPDLAKLHFAAHLGCQSRHPSGLRSILAEFFQAPVEIHEFVGHWMSLPRNCRLRLNRNQETCRLGQNTMLGARTWDCQQKFQVRMGPITFENYEKLLPGGESLERCKAIVRNYAGIVLLWELNLVLKQVETPPLQLGRQGRLGWTSWLLSRPPERDADDLTLVFQD